MPHLVPGQLLGHITGLVPLEGNQDTIYVKNEPRAPQVLKHTQGALLETELCKRGCGSKSNVIRSIARLRVKAGCKGNEKSQQGHRSGCKDDRTNNREQKGQQHTHRQSPELHAMSKPGSGVRTNAMIHNIPYFAVWSWH